MFHLHVGYRSRDGRRSCDAARAYFAREDRYRSRPDKVRWVTSLNMPEWASGNSAIEYWRAAEGPHTRVNARTAMDITFAIPKALSPAHQNRLALDMIKRVSELGLDQRSGKRTRPLTAAFHEGAGRNPHVHLLLSTSIADGYSRGPQQWFRRYRPEKPSDGGARRCRFMNKKAWLKQVRQLWAGLANRALRAVGLAASVSHESLADQGIKRKPSLHLGPLSPPGPMAAARRMRERINKAIGSAHQPNEDARGALVRDDVPQDASRLEADGSHSTWAQGLDDAYLDELREKLKQHPLYGNKPQDLSAVSAIIVETSEEDARRFLAFRRNPGKRRAFEMACGHGWVFVHTPCGYWGLNEVTGAALKMGDFYLCTDAVEVAASAALVKAAHGLEVKQPVVLGFNSEMEQSLVKSVGAHGLQWEVRGNQSENRSRLNRPR